MWHDAVVLPQPPIRRALKALVDALCSKAEKELFEVVDYVPFKHEEIGELTVRFWFTVHKFVCVDCVAA